jgi:hypothetical protein
MKTDAYSNWTDTRGIAEYTGLSTYFFEKDRCAKCFGVPYIKIGKRVLYSKRDVDTFLKSRTQDGAPHSLEGAPS